MTTMDTDRSDRRESSRLPGSDSVLSPKVSVLPDPSRETRGHHGERSGPSETGRSKVDEDSVMTCLSKKYVDENITHTERGVMTTKSKFYNRGGGPETGGGPSSPLRVGAGPHQFQYHYLGPRNSEDKPHLTDRRKPDFLSIKRHHKVYLIFT